MQYGLIGKHLPHSYSKEIHEYIGEYSYEHIELSREELDAFMRARDFEAINVTIPYKETVIPYLDGISKRAKSIGAVNTIINSGGRLYGGNTDFYGIAALVNRLGLSLEDRDVLILGTGGTSKTAVAVAESFGAASVKRVSRTQKEGAVTYEEMYAGYTDAQVLINTTPVGMFPNTGGRPVDLEKFRNLEGVLDVIYNPLSSRLVRQARMLGIPASGGLYMLVAQAVKAAEVFLGKKLDRKLIDDIFNKLVAEKENKRNESGYKIIEGGWQRCRAAV